MFWVIFFSHNSPFASPSCQIILLSPLSHECFKLFKTFTFVPQTDENAEMCDMKFSQIENNVRRI